jgi:hypothetical protein
MSRRVNSRSLAVPNSVQEPEAFTILEVHERSILAGALEGMSVYLGYGFSARRCLTGLPFQFDCA